MADHLVRLITRDGTLRAVAAETTLLVEECRHRQQTDPTATVALGRIATAAALMGGLLKGEQRLALIVEGSGPLKRLQAETDAHGRVRATLKVPVADLPPRDGRFDVAGAVGHAGFLHVIKDLGLKEPYRGMVQLATSEIGDDLATYFATSEQIPSSVALGVALDHDMRVTAAGGFLLQLLPGGDPALVEQLEGRLAHLPPPTTLLRQGVAPTAILERLLDGIPTTPLGQIPLEFACSCSRAQVSGVLRLLGAAELDEILAEQGEATVTCDFCKEPYRFEREELEAIRAGLSSPAPSGE
ncbi:MAG: Hsp33 family molecular chaperone HslO [Deltaproteobacteria bacterium]|nr:MAG: Hsp33 family molecular chaperone HslO [Deltaproteobacteria bacterium]